MLIKRTCSSSACASASSAPSRRAHGPAQLTFAGLAKAPLHNITHTPLSIDLALPRSSTYLPTYSFLIPFIRLTARK